MEPYLFFGTVTPQRAAVTIPMTLSCERVHFGTDRKANMDVSILAGQIVVRVEAEDEWPIHDLRNVVKNLVHEQLAVLSFLSGNAYDVEVSRAVNRERGIDVAFGVDIPCLTKRANGTNLWERYAELLLKMQGPNAVFLSRCFSDLVSAMKQADDTGFYCYRAIESLRHHCAATHGLAGTTKNKQWEKFRDVAGCTEVTARELESAAIRLRHGELTCLTDKERSDLLTSTWNLVEGYLKAMYRQLGGRTAASSRV
jgi:hypothetical protein